jgi:hypothetical protein
VTEPADTGVTPASAPIARRSYATALLALAAGGVVLLWAYGLTWGTAEVPLLSGAADTTRTQELSGRDLFPGAAMAGWVALAAVAGIVATRSWGRILVAVVGLLAGVAGAGVAVAFGLAPEPAIDAAVAAGVGGGASAASQAVAGWAAAVVGGVVVIAASVWTLVRGRRWPTLGTRYERRSRSERSLSPWDAQDMGQDPTDDLVE